MDRRIECCVYDCFALGLALPFRLKFYNDAAEHDTIPIFTFT